MTGESHRMLREQLGVYALGQLGGDPWRAVHEHLTLCASCRADLEEIAPVAGMLGTLRDRRSTEDVTGDAPDPAGAGGPGAGDGAPPLSPELLAEVRAASGASGRVGPRRGSAVHADRPVPRDGRWSPRWLPVAAAAVVTALAAGIAGYAVGTAGRVPDVPREAVAVRTLDPAVRASADVVAHTWGMEVTLTATGFREGATYVVTVTDDAGRTVGAGEFLGTGSEQMRCNLNSSVLRADASTVQVRDAAGAVVLDAAV